MTSRSRITSRQNPRIKDAAQLRTSRARQRQGRFLIDGVREISRAIAAGVRCVEAFVCDELCVSPECRNVVQSLEATDAEIFSVPPSVYAKLAFGEREDGVVVVAERRSAGCKICSFRRLPLVAVLDGIEKPGNLARSCAAPMRPVSTPSWRPTCAPIFTIQTRFEPAWAPCLARASVKQQRAIRFLGCANAVW